MGSVYFKLGDYINAEEMFRKALQINPLSTEAYSNITFTLFKSKKFEQGIEAGKEAEELGIENTNLLNNLALILTELGKYDEAIEKLNRAISMDDKFLTAHINHGIAYQNKGMLKEEKSNYKNANEIDPDSA